MLINIQKGAIEGAIIDLQHYSFLICFKFIIHIMYHPNPTVIFTETHLKNLNNASNHTYTKSACCDFT